VPGRGGRTSALGGAESAKRGLEEGPVDAAVEDRNAHLDALSDHLLLIHLQLVGELAGRQVIGHCLTSRIVESG
jgi:hypothetical protein